MTICEELRQAVLQAAIQGKLTEQRTEDGTAEELLEEIKKEKARLLLEGKIKKEKPLPEISEDEIPFDIPENWKWVYLYSILEVTPSNGKSVKETPAGNTKTLSLSATTSGRFNREAYKLVDFTDTDKEKYALKKNDILIQRSNSRDYVGTACLYDQEDNEFVYPDLMMRMHSFACIDPVFVVTALQSPTSREYYRKNASGTSESMPKINQQIVNQTLLPLPPLAEQHRIVTAVNTLMARIDALEKIETELEVMKTAFPGDMRDAILQAAMQGKLTEQRQEDGTAENLLKEITAEKDRLIKEGKIKKEKALPAISEEEIPFDIPESWKWVRIHDIFYCVNGKAFKPTDWTSKGIPIVRIQNLNNADSRFNYFNGSVEEDYILYGGELLFAWSGTPGTSFGAHIWEGKKAVLNQHIFKLIFPELIVSKEYMKFSLNQRVGQLITQAHGSAGLQHVTRKVFESTVVPLPPLAEQHRIVARLNELLPLCDALEGAR